MPRCFALPLDPESARRLNRQSVRHRLDRVLGEQERDEKGFIQLQLPALARPPPETGILHSPSGPPRLDENTSSKPSGVQTGSWLLLSRVRRLGSPPPSETR